MKMKRVPQAAAMVAAAIQRLMLHDPAVVAASHVGSSRYREDYNDLDIAVLLHEGIDVQAWADNYKAQGYTSCSHYADGGTDDEWTALRSSDLNLIAMTSVARYHKTLLADEVCKALDLKAKVDRIKVYHVVRDGASAEEAAVSSSLAMLRQPARVIYAEPWGL